MRRGRRRRRAPPVAGGREGTAPGPAPPSGRERAARGAYPCGTIRTHHKLTKTKLKCEPSGQKKANWMSPSLVVWVTVEKRPPGHRSGGQKKVWARSLVTQLVTPPGWARARDTEASQTRLGRAAEGGPKANRRRIMFWRSTQIKWHSINRRHVFDVGKKGIKHGASGCMGSTWHPGWSRWR